jgi:hypothetical protein
MNVPRNGDWNINLNVGGIVGFILCILLVMRGKDQAFKYIGLAGLIYLCGK